MARKPKNIVLENLLEEENNNLKEILRNEKECRERIKDIENRIRERDKERIFAELERKGLTAEKVLEMITKQK